MSEPKREDLLRAIQAMRYRLDDLEEMVKSVIPEKKWYSRGEFAIKTDLEPQTVSNYLARGEYGTNQRKVSGRWQIHKSELNE